MKNSKAKNSNSDESMDFETIQLNQPINNHSSSMQSDPSDLDSDLEKKTIEKSFQSMNRKGKKSGGFQSMGLSPSVFKAIGHLGYKVPTPIQRKTVPIIMEGKDIVAMARTGSGKTAAFLIPLLERLKSHQVKVGARGLILSPSRELAMQTLKFCQDLGKYTQIRACVLVGGENMEEQFSALASNPDILIATPGRLLHLIVEMSLDLKTIEYVVLDEADRLFELGLEDQLTEIMHKLPESRQTCLFSATLPKSLVDFAKAGLTDPALIRLDVDSKMSKDLQLYFFSIKQEEKDATLLYLLKTFIAKNDQQQTIVFAATKHHVEYLHELLLTADIQNTYIYGALDQQARRIHLARFRSGKEKILIVTDVAARGLDIPLLDNVINYDFPGNCKVFIHRVGRVARAGRSGKAWSLVTNDEIPFMLDLQLFTCRPLVYGTVYMESQKTPDYTRDLVFGSVPSSLIGFDLELVNKWNSDNVNLQTMSSAMVNASKMYYKSRPTPSQESFKRTKELLNSKFGMHPLLGKEISKDEIQQSKMLESISQFRPTETIFEIGKKGQKKSNESVLMQMRRQKLHQVIDLKKETDLESQKRIIQEQQEFVKKQEQNQNLMANEEELLGFHTSRGKKRVREESKDKDYYMNYQPLDAFLEKGYALQTKTGDASFIEKAKTVSFDLVVDDTDGLRKSKSKMVWDSKKHNFVRPTVGSDNKKRIRTESGASIPASFKTKRFSEWQQRRKIHLPRTGEEELPEAKMIAKSRSFGNIKRFKHTKITAPDPNSKNSLRKMSKSFTKGKDSSHANPSSGTSHYNSNKRVKNEIKNPGQIAKERREKEKRRQKTGRHFLAKNKKKNK